MATQSEKIALAAKTQALTAELTKLSEDFEKSGFLGKGATPEAKQYFAEQERLHKEIKAAGDAFMQAIKP